MKKSSISKNEYDLIEKIKNTSMGVFEINDVTRFMEWKKTKAYQTVHNLKNKGIISEVMNGKYVLSLFMEHNLFEIASHIVWPSYISFWTALNYYKFTEQLPRTIFVAATKARKEVEFENNKIKFVTIAETRFFGYRKVEGVIIADREKALIDSLLLPRYAGGVDEIFKCLKTGWSELDKEVLVEYALRMENKSLLKRLGYLIERGDLEISEELIEELHKRIGKGYSKLDPELEKKGEYNKNWGVVVNW